MIDSYLSQGDKQKVKCKQPHPGFELGSLIPYPTMITIKRGVMVIVAGIGHGDMSSNPGLIAFHIALIPLGKV